jgi:hydroxypyruvate reductase
VAGADAAALVRRALTLAAIRDELHGRTAVDVIAVGKAAPAMSAAFAAAPVAPRPVLTVGVNDAGHPIPDDRSMAASRRALDLVRGSPEDGVVVLLLSGGGSALMALPAAGVSLDQKQRTVATLLAAGADITELNTVRKHLSAIKGGRLAAACRARMLTLALSDVVGDDLSVIASGPTVADETTWAMAIDVLDRRGGRAAYPAAAVALLEAGAAGRVPDTPKPGDARLSRSQAMVIGSRASAIEGARRAAEALGYHVHVVDAPVVGIARGAAMRHAELIERVLPSLRRPACILSAGETTVHVLGRGRGGRNQEFALAMAHAVAQFAADVAVASVGTDGIDGPTDAAGAVVDRTTLTRAAAARLDPESYLRDNDSYHFFQPLGDLIRLGPTGTNVGDLQVVLARE